MSSELAAVASIYGRWGGGCSAIGTAAGNMRILGMWALAADGHF